MYKYIRTQVTVKAHGPLVLFPCLNATKICALLMKQLRYDIKVIYINKPVEMLFKIHVLNDLIFILKVVS